MAITAPFKKDGGLWFQAPRDGHPNLEWRVSEPFEAGMKLVSLCKAKGQEFFLWADEMTNATYPMNSTAMHNTLMKCICEDGHIYGMWSAVLCGNQYSITLLREIDDSVYER